MIELRCSDLDATLAMFEALGFRIAMIMPADDPAVIELVGPYAVRLVRDGERRAEVHRGRAGMQYRDLIPDRLGGRLIASQIRIPEGGPVADYVHYHAIEFQMIYCRAGWVRVVYEDQGEPFTMRAGDCVVQPPRIRHRVLEASPGLEVIELAMPAVHATYVDHELALPTPMVRLDRDFGGQRFSLCQRPAGAEELFVCQRAGAYERHDLGVAAATNGLAHARVVRGAPERYIAGIRFGFVLEGEATLIGDGVERKLVRDDAFAVETEHALVGDVVLLEVVI